MSKWLTRVLTSSSQHVWRSGAASWRRCRVPSESVVILLFRTPSGVSFPRSPIHNSAPTNNPQHKIKASELIMQFKQPPIQCPLPRSSTFLGLLRRILETYPSPSQGRARFPRKKKKKKKLPPAPSQISHALWDTSNRFR